MREQAIFTFFSSSDGWQQHTMEGALRYEMWLAGYIYGMFLAAIIIGLLSEKGFSDTYIKCLFSLLIGSLIIFSIGVAYLGSIIGYDKAISFGLLPFLPSEIFKIALAVFLIPSLAKFIK